MIVGIGVDCASVSRLGASIGRAHFVQRVFGPAEQALLESRGSRAAQTAAANFAAKEAFLKAVGTGLGGFALADIQAVRRESGAPEYCFSGRAAEYMEKQGLQAHLSLTHEGDLAMAFCVLEKL